MGQKLRRLEECRCTAKSVRHLESIRLPFGRIRWKIAQFMLDFGGERMGLARVLVAVALVVVLGVLANPAGATATEEVTALLHEFMNAAGRGDRAIFDKFFADDVIYTRATGVVITKADIMASLRKAESKVAPAQKTTYSAEDITVHEYGDTVVVAFRLVGRTEHSDGKTETAYYRNTGTFLRRSGRWQAVAWQATKISEGGAATK
jgi:ketosteroid isomerase-like protein